MAPRLENETVSNNERTLNRLVVGLIISLLVWGALLSIGAALQTVNRDWRKAAIILACVLSFLALWALVLFGYRKRGSTRDERGGPPRLQPLPWLGLVSACFAFGVFIAPAESLNQFVVFWLSMLLSGFGFVTALIVLSSTRPDRAKGMGIVTLLLSVIVFLGLLLRVVTGQPQVQSVTTERGEYPLTIISCSGSIQRLPHVQVLRLFDMHVDVAETALPVGGNGSPVMGRVCEQLSAVWPHWEWISRGV